MKALITGGTSGIGYEVAKNLSLRGYMVYVGIHTKSQIVRFRKQNKNKNIKPIKLDITDQNDLKKINKLDLDILVSHAGIGMGGSIAEIPIELMRENFEVNVFANFRLIQIVLKNMINKGSGRIIVTSSLLGKVPFPFLGVYSATKASIISMCYALKKELKLINKNIHVSVITPGAYHTGFNNIMLENKYEFMKNGSYFKGKFSKIRKKENNIFRFIEKHCLDSIVNKFIKAIITDKPRFIYSSPFIQVLFVKLYNFFFL